MLAAVLEGDLGRHRKITKFRTLRPVLVTAAIVPLFLAKVTIHGEGLAVELAGVAAGLAGGLVDLSHGRPKPVAVTLTVIGAVVSLGLGALRGRADEASAQDGSPYVQWSVLSPDPAWARRSRTVRARCSSRSSRRPIGRSYGMLKVRLHLLDGLGQRCRGSSRASCPA